MDPGSKLDWFENEAHQAAWLQDHEMRERMERHRPATDEEIEAFLKESQNDIERTKEAN